ncbi:hypothetical protein EV690_3200 [Celerinatantimonas diazotrophica]|uniref:Uncharacterized protein n=2 Tax=Celerinatantimonas diazotrophica TaxID=412034 RepID=A0A4R1J8Z4_9GAMM|nr:hypothetical protein EV690_3200 [Celerinatantimonas diazotrophica]CAG9295814.1 hypothetical protein CEDIAZO_00941 [Celerinatantimonas diazotrophica]
MVSILILLIMMTIATLNIIELGRETAETVTMSRDSNVARMKLINQGSTWVNHNIDSNAPGQWLCQGACFKNSHKLCGVYTTHIIIGNHQLNIGMIKALPPSSVGICAKSQLTQPVGHVLWMNQ